MSDRFNPPLSANEEAVAAKARQPKRLPILCLDFDGVLHGYQSGWQGAAIIPDPPVPGAIGFLHAAVERFQVAIYSSRSGQPGGIDAMRGWLMMNVMAVIEDRREAEHVFGLIQWPTEKPAALVTLDDRAIQFTGAWPSLDDIAAFQPWNKRPTTSATGPQPAGGDGWCFDMEAAPRDGTWVLGALRREHENVIPFRWSQAQMDKHGNGWDFRGNGLLTPYAWKSLDKAPLKPTPAVTGAEGGQR